LLRETLKTFQLLFPPTGDNASALILQRETARHKLDACLSNMEVLRLHYDDHEHPRDALDPEDVRSLYEKYPYWGERLYNLWKEADDPTPITRIERWAESKRNPRFTYWCTVVSISVAILIGLLASALAAVQVWISYCAWVDDPTKPRCSRNRGVVPRTILRL
jgi:hypothetical protein